MSQSRALNVQNRHVYPYLFSADKVENAILGPSPFLCHSLKSWSWWAVNWKARRHQSESNCHSWSKPLKHSCKVGILSWLDREKIFSFLWHLTITMLFLLFNVNLFLTRACCFNPTLMTRVNNCSLTVFCFIILSSHLKTPFLQPFHSRVFQQRSSFCFFPEFFPTFSPYLKDVDLLNPDGLPYRLAASTSSPALLAAGLPLALIYRFLHWDPLGRASWWPLPMLAVFWRRVKTKRHKRVLVLKISILLLL